MVHQYSGPVDTRRFNVVNHDQTFNWKILKRTPTNAILYISRKLSDRLKAYLLKDGSGQI
jgi:hypothetical protein